MTDTWYGVLHDEAARRPRPAGPTAGGIGGRLNAASTRVQADTGSVSYWLKRTVVFPIGERWALIAVTAALFNPLVSLVSVLVWGVLAFGVHAARCGRCGPAGCGCRCWTRSTRRCTVTTVRWPARLPVVRPMGPLTLAVLAALGPAALLVGGAAGWPVTATRVACAGGCRWRCWCCWWPGWARARRTTARWTGWCRRRCGPASTCSPSRSGWSAGCPAWLIFGYVFVLTVHHYDLTARLEKRQAAPPLHPWTLGWEGRSVLLAVAAIAGFAGPVMATLGAYLLVVFVASVVLAWVVLPARATAGGGRTGAGWFAGLTAGAAG